MRNQRTAKDERDYVENLRREEPIKTEVIVELKQMNRVLLENNARILQALIDAQDSLRAYRVAALEQTRRGARCHHRLHPRLHEARVARLRRVASEGRGGVSRLS